MELETLAEKNAQKAETLPAFSGIKLLHIKNSIAELLRQIGSNGIFEQYTRHDISHIDAMLRSLDWLIPEASREHMTSADWLMIVLSIYFHDLGLLVTRDEFAKRDQSDFRAFCDACLFAGEDGVDYRDKVDRLPPDDRERFLYQDFVRFKHAERVKFWITGKAHDSLGIATTVVAEIDNLLRDVDSVFRDGLGSICESHHLDDLDDLRKYNPRCPYGNRPQETANLQFCAVILRSADLLHITQDRTPSIAFRMLNPSDPISQQEWAKQMAVRSVRPQLGRDKEGNFSKTVPQDTIEIHATFKVQDGFFGLTSYVKFAEDQLKKCNSWIDSAQRSQAVNVVFPWKKIDDSLIETQGFEKKPFEFTVDEPKILKLLTGHTLYNDTSVVLRELVQNSLDAVRLQCHIDGKPFAETGRVYLHWDSKARILTVEDNGTGMSQRIIEDHLLKVGSSLYQDPDFLKKHPDFHPISRFGIGVLSCFMIADKVEVLTCHPDDSKARQLTLKSVHGRYLVRTLDKHTDFCARSLSPHGTRIKLTLRASATIEDPVAIAKKWIVVPGCTVTMQVDNKPAIEIGHGSVAKALEKTLADVDIFVSQNGDSPENGSIQIKEFTDDATGLSLAVAVRWSAVFRQWEFLRHDAESDYAPSLGLSIEGVRVQFTTPGFKTATIYAVANASGKSAPKTNVARSNIEESEAWSETLKTLYSLYLRHISDELRALHSEREFSLTWSVQEANYLAQPFIDHERLIDPTFASEALDTLPLLLIEADGKRELASLKAIDSLDSFETLNGRFYESAEVLLREVSGSASLRSLAASLGTPSINLPKGTILCRDSINSKFHESAFKGREPRRIRINHTQRHLDIQWGKTSNPPVWRQLFPFDEEPRRKRRSMRFFVASQDIPIEGESGESGIRVDNTLWIFAKTPLSKHLHIIASHSAKLAFSKANAFFLSNLTRTLFFSYSSLTYEKSFLLKELNDIWLKFPDEASMLFPLAELHEAFQQANMRIFDPSAWIRPDE